MSNQEHVRFPTSDATWGQIDHEASPEIVERRTVTLPAPLTSLIGREREIAAVRTLLAHPSTRILTLTGTGGVGKTRLALAVAAEVQQNFPDGVYFISLESIHDADLVLPTIVQAIGLHANNRSPLETLQMELRQRRQLLVLDNFETVVSSAPRLLDLLATCPHLKLLATSREALRIRGEHELVVLPLALPDPRHKSTGESLRRYGAVALFLERAQEVQPTLQLTASTAPLIAEICRKLDGLPLALELAAARLKVLSLSALLDRLEHRLHVLTGGPRDLPTRQQTLRQTIAWSYDLLSSEDQRFFRLLAVFVDGCTLETAEAVYCALGGGRESVLDGVTSLLDKHLLHQSTRDQGEHSLRLMMHETIREYGLEALIAAQELETVRQCHAEYYLRLAETLLKGAKPAMWLDQLELEYANMRAALQWALEQPASEMALRLGGALLHFWEGHQRLDERKIFLRHSLASIHEISVRTPASALFAPEALAHKESDLGDARHLARSLYLLGMIGWVIGDFTMARTYAEEGLAKASDSNEKVTIAYLLDLLGQIALDQGEDTRARVLLEEGLALHREVGDTLGSLNALFFLERVICALGEVTQAQVYAEEHLALSEAIGFQSGIVGALTFLGRLAFEKGNTATASELFEESLALLRETSENASLTVATNLQGIGVTLAAQKRPIEAVRLWGAAESLCATLPEERAFVSRASSAVRAELGDDVFTRALAEGQAMTLEQALAAVEYIAHSIQSPTQALRRSEKARQHQPSSHDLTAREEEVLRLVARGLTDAQVAEALVVSPRTVNAHLRSIYTKLQISSRNAATFFALEHGLI